MTVPEIKEWLNRGWNIECEITQLEAERRKIKDSINHITGNFEERTGSGSFTNNEEKICRYVDYINILEVKKAKLIKIRVEIETAIEAVEQSKERSVLRYRYINNLSWHKIAELMNYDVRSIYRIHGNALLNIAKKIKDVSKCH